MGYIILYVPNVVPEHGVLRRHIEYYRAAFFPTAPPSKASSKYCIRLESFKQARIISATRIIKPGLNN